MKQLTISMLAVFALLTAPTAADWVPSDGHKMHFPQLPDETGWAVNATQPMILADDWQCSETGWIKDFHFWGAWRNGLEGQILYFVLSIHDDIPASESPTGYSMPGNTLREIEVFEWAVVPIDPPTLEGWYDPATGEVIPEDHQNYWQYNVFLPESEWFWQEQGTIYWFNISAVVQDPLNTVWGWKSSIDHWNDDAVWATWGNLNWVEMYEPPFEPRFNEFNIAIDPFGNFLWGGGTDFYGSGWYFYEGSEWWNIWFYDHPFDPGREKKAHIEFDLFLLQSGAPSFIELAVNWSTDFWSIEQPPGDSFPPLPGVDEALYIGREILYTGEVVNGHFVFDWDWPDYNPEWVSIDVRGYNFEIPVGLIEHDCVQSLDLSFVVTGDGGIGDTCQYYKSPYVDYAPQGMPDFDQKQFAWFDANGWTHCGPVAAANCLWWFDSKFEPNPIDSRPFYPGPGNPSPNDGYPLVSSYGVGWDDHDTNNVQPLVNDLANLMNTNSNPASRGTWFQDFINGFRQYLINRGLDNRYKDSIQPIPSHAFIKEQVLESQDVILLLGFYEDMGTHWCYLGSHYVTVAGVCTTATSLCISDPYFDLLEGNPPGVPVHGGTVHNDADFVSGPHSQIQHDPYSLTSVVPPLGTFPVEVLPGYQLSPSDIPVFAQSNNMGIDPCFYQGGPVITAIDIAYVVCPYDSCANQYPGDVDNDGTIGMSDIIFLINYLYQGGPAPAIPANADPNGDCCIDINDVIFMINLIFHGGPTPVPCTCVSPPVCITASPDHTLGKVRSFIDGYVPALGPPTGNNLEELWPNFKENFAVLEWRDSGDMQVSAGDSLHFWSNHYNAPSWAKIEEITATLVLSVMGTNDTIYVEMVGPPVPFLDPVSGITVPVGTLWHESHPTYSNTYQLVYWQNIGSPALMPSHVILMQALNGPVAGTARNYQVVDIRTDFIVSPLPPRPIDEYDHNLDGWRPWHAATPVGTLWKELWPGYNDHWILDVWFDNGSGLFDYCDTIEFVNSIDPQVRIRKHIESVRPTIKVKDPGVVDTMYFDFMCGNPHVDDMTSVLNTYWMQVYPVFGKRYVCAGWTDNGNGLLDSCDWIDLISISPPDSGFVIQAHVEAYQTDIVTTLLTCCAIRGDINHDGSIDITDLTYFVDYFFGGGAPPPCLEEADLNGDGSIDITDLTYLVDYMFGGGPAPVPCP